GRLQRGEEARMILAQHNQPMSDDYPVTPETIAAALQAQLDERARASADCPGLTFLADGTPVLRGGVVAFLRRQDDDAFTAPQRVDLMQLRESNAAAKLAEAIAKTVYNRELLDLDRQTQAHVRFLAVHCIRMSNQNWKD